jgi:hypothetical protein
VNLYDILQQNWQSSVSYSNDQWRNKPFATDTLLSDAPAAENGGTST